MKVHTAINHCYCLHKDKTSFLYWLTEILGPVILGAKPSEILSFRLHEADSIMKIEAIQSIFNQSSKIAYKQISYHNNCIKILFYHPTLLEDTLKDQKNLRFLQHIGYNTAYDLENYLDHLTEKIARGNIPDEIGIFLGYPLKDVLGFIGHPSLKLTKINGWRVYGDERLSDRRYNEILRTKNEIRSMLQCNTPKDILQSVS
ncbi:DUF3793 family protein [Geosporobacter ferrireducens]|uniref:DUF3793 domain-containing protein n=1 Tax=Geosporobacter ferrireducens TaxID=1424294 RepID=A0A1D8GH53_9FIRM|nr:hypothetical protein Gferi_11755 [Geosporobacter ferrireducens]